MAKRNDHGEEETKSTAKEIGQSEREWVSIFFVVNHGEGPCI